MHINTARLFRVHVFCAPLLLPTEAAVRGTPGRVDALISAAAQLSKT